MKTNHEVAIAFVENRSFVEAGHLWTGCNAHIYSYSTKMGTKSANGVFLINSRDYSNTTRRHKSHIFQALRKHGETYFEVPCFDNPTQAEHKRNFAYLQDIADGFMEKAKKARKPETMNRYFEAMNQATITANAYKAAFISE